MIGVELKFVSQVLNSEDYYDTADFRLLSQAIFVRVRNQVHLECKFNERAAPAHTHCTEHTFSLVPEPEQGSQMNPLVSRILPAWQYAKTVHEAIVQNSLHE